MKKYISGLITGVIISFCMVGFAAELNIIENPYPVLINGVVESVEGYNINGFTFLKLGDFKKAGLTVKFNETDKQIEVTSPVTTSTTAPLTTLNNTEVTSMSTKPTSTPDGITQIDEWEGKYYIGYLYIRNKIREKGYDLILNTATEKWNLVKGEQILISAIPTTKTYGYSSIEINYYINTMLPLIK